MVSKELPTITAFLVISSFCIAEASNSTATFTMKVATVTAAVRNSSIAQSIAPAKTTSAASGSSNVPSTPKPTTGTTVSPKPTEGTPTPSGRKFDAASFIGGIILGTVLAVVLIFGYKWYQNRRKSYHSL